ncbi:hypothetical protein BWQ96_03986 [Gracilariopsis chorda]|uniref:BZIP domain-containing protein n=1 Tax=Gracilariopsis chorda TaxID=448386 RepID=A0A2V3IYX2_9FLOR|nr:hypothetical protein BWQ96_03986 [Gracilariopsis chorda]|eukprot:PXF46330.1 hypothetical protein BWQ96_03986 [Gracilariopsis chorda]
MSTSNTPRQVSAREENHEIRDQVCPEPWVSSADFDQDEAVNSSRFKKSRQTPKSPSISLRQLDFVPVDPLTLSPTVWSKHDNTVLLLKPQTNSFLEHSAAQPEYHRQNLSPSESPGADRTISEVTIAGLHQTSYKSKNVSMNAKPLPSSRTLCFTPQRQLHSMMTNDGTPVAHRNSFGTGLPHPQAGRRSIMPWTAEECDIPIHTFPSQPRKRTEVTSCRDLWGNASPLSSLHTDKDSRYANVPQPEILQDAGGKFPASALIPSGILQTAQKTHRDINGERKQAPKGGAVVQRVLKRIAKSNSNISETINRLKVMPMHQHVSKQTRNDEKQVRKRITTEEKNEEELKKIRRVRNRESVEKCRAKQKLRLEKLEKEEKALRAECILMSQVAESLQRNWAAVAMEFERITGKEAGRCPLIMPPDVGLADMSTGSNG